MNDLEREIDLIIGIHSIEHALKNPQRKNSKLWATEEGLTDFCKKTSMQKKDLEKFSVQRVTLHNLQEAAKKSFKKMGYEFTRIPSQIFLETSPMPILHGEDMFKKLEKNPKLKILCLDGVTDIHNGAAILRTAAFYAADVLILESKESFGLTPAFFRIASGATEHVHIVQVGNLSKVLKRLQDIDVTVIGFSENAENHTVKKNSESVCLVLGAEDRGLSNAVERILTHKVSIPSLGAIKSLNVSVASAIAMSQYF
ncbi:MAG: RNA methyltransferase [Bacteriovoracaceae bacterium]|nr:RNA methyltransferase [Bacteriovoracaceae bacterium]